MLNGGSAQCLEEESWCCSGRRLGNEFGLGVPILCGTTACGELSERIGAMRSLQTLDLGHNHLTQLPEALGDLVELRDFLYLHDNRLESLPSSMQRLRELRYLNISENQFSIFPESICDMASLVELRLTDNQLTSLPDSIARLANLRELHLRNNRLRTLPAAVGRLSNLRQIDLRGNPIEVLRDTGLQKLLQPGAARSTLVPTLENLRRGWTPWRPAGISGTSVAPVEQRTTDRPLRLRCDGYLVQSMLNSCWRHESVDPGGQNDSEASR